MKLLSYIILVAVFAFGMSTTNATDTNDNTIIELNGGNISAGFDATSETIALRMHTDGSTERVMIVLSGRGGTVVYKERIVVNSRGTTHEIPMEGLAQGNYFLRVKGASLNYSGRFKKK